MATIGIFFLLISLTYGKDCHLSDEELAELDNAFIEADNYTTEIGFYEDAIICIGATRAGKSTLINYLIGNELKGFKNSKYGEYKIIKANNNSNGPEIGQGLVSKTTIPTKWTSTKLGGFSIYDAPGFDDNRGPLQDITNSFHIYLLMKKVRSLKYILVIDFIDIQRDNVKPFLKFLYDFENIFRDRFSLFISTVSIVFSKVPRKLDGKVVDVEMIKYLLNKIAVTIKSVSSVNLNNFLDYIIKNINHVALFRKAESININSSDIDFNIFSAIRETKSVKRSFLQNIAPTASQESKLCLYYAKDKWLSMSQFIEIQQSLLNLSNNVLKDLKNSNVTKDTNTLEKRTKLLNIYTLLHESIKNEFHVYGLILNIEDIDDEIKKKIKDCNLLIKVKIFYFVSRVLTMDDVEKLLSSFQDLRLSLLKIFENNGLKEKQKFYRIYFAEEREPLMFFPIN